MFEVPQYVPLQEVYKRLTVKKENVVTREQSRVSVFGISMFCDQLF